MPISLNEEQLVAEAILRGGDYREADPIAGSLLAAVLAGKATEEPSGVSGMPRKDRKGKDYSAGGRVSGEARRISSGGKLKNGLLLINGRDKDLGGEPVIQLGMPSPGGNSNSAARPYGSRGDWVPQLSSDTQVGYNFAKFYGNRVFQYFTKNSYDNQDFQPFITGGSDPSYESLKTEISTGLRYLAKEMAYMPYLRKGQIGQISDSGGNNTLDLSGLTGTGAQGDPIVFNLPGKYKFIVKDLLKLYPVRITFGNATNPTAYSGDCVIRTNPKGSSGFVTGDAYIPGIAAGSDSTIVCQIDDPIDFTFLNPAIAGTSTDVYVYLETLAQLNGAGDALFNSLEDVADATTDFGGLDPSYVRGEQWEGAGIDTAPSITSATDVTNQYQILVQNSGGQRASQGDLSGNVFDGSIKIIMQEALSDYYLRGQAGGFVVNAENAVAGLGLTPLANVSAVEPGRSALHNDSLCPLDQIIFTSFEDLEFCRSYTETQDMTVACPSPAWAGVSADKMSATAKLLYTMGGFQVDYIDANQELLPAPGQRTNMQFYRPVLNAGGYASDVQMATYEGSLQLIAFRRDRTKVFKNIVISA